MISESKISPFQLTALLVVCRLFTLVTLTSGQAEAGSVLAGILLGDGLQLVLALLLIKLLDFLGNNRLLLVVCWLITMLAAASAANHCAAFLSDSFYGGSRAVLMVVILVAAAVLTAWLGLNSFARAAPAVALLALCGLAAVVAGNVRGMQWGYLPPMDLSWQGVGQVALYRAATNYELLLLPLLQRQSTKPLKKRAIAFWLGLSAVVSAVLSLSVMLSLGYYAQGRRYPIFELARAARLVTERMDTVLMGLWVLLGFIKVSVVLWLACDLWGSLFSPAKQLRRPVLHGTLVAVAAVVLLSGCSTQDTIANKTIVTMVELEQQDGASLVRVEFLDMSGGKEQKRYLVCQTQAESFSQGVRQLEQEYSRRFYLQGCGLAVLSGEYDSGTLAQALEQLDALGELRPLTPVLLSEQPVLEAGSEEESSAATGLRRLFTAKGGWLADGYTLKDSLAYSRSPRLSVRLPVVSVRDNQPVLTGYWESAPDVE